MRILLDECVDQRLQAEVVGHDMMTVPMMGWANLKDAEVLRRAQDHFDVLLTVDRNLPYQQNLSRFNIAVVVLHAPTNRLVDLRPLVPQLLTVLPAIRMGQATVISAVSAQD